MGVKVTLGQLKDRILIQSLTLTPDGQGGSSETWNDVATVWAKIEPVSASERIYGQRLEYQRSHKVVIRYLADLTANVNATYRFLFDNRVFQIKGIKRDMEEKFWLFIDAEENRGT